MRKIICLTILFGISFFFLGFKMIHSGGIIGYSGSPGEGSCGNCHSGGPAGTTISVTATPEFIANNYISGTNYTVTITVAHPTLNAFGFDCEILTAGNTNSGTMLNAGSGVFLAYYGSRKNAIQTSTKHGTGSASWTFEWTAPTNDSAAVIYVAGNAVNANGSKSGDAPAIHSFSLNAQPAGIPVNNANEFLNVSLFPNPANDFAKLCYSLPSPQVISIDLLDITGKLIRNLIKQNQEAGSNINILDLKGIEKGIYFIKISSNGKKKSQRLISVQ